MNKVVKFFTNWTKKKAIISTVSVLTVVGLGLGTWAVWPLLGLSKTKSSEQVEKPEAAKEQELTYYQDVVVRAVSNEKDLSVSFVDGAGEIPNEKLSVKLVRVGKADDVDMEELNQSTASDMFNMDEYAANRQ